MNIDKCDVIFCEIENFIGSEEAEEMLSIANNSLKPMLVLGENKPTHHRVANGTWIPDHVSNAAISVKHKISKLVNTSPDNFEQLHIVKYEVGGEYKAHLDYFKDEKHITKEGQRVYSALFYLNDDFDGGETDFPKINFRAIPKKNKLLIWRNLNTNKKIIEASLHAGLPVTKGVKYIGIFWIRENKFD